MTWHLALAFLAAAWPLAAVPVGVAVARRMEA
jgi:hypothetical protein